MPRATFHVHVWKSVHLCNLTIPTKSLQVRNQKPNRKSAILNFLVIFCVIFAIFRCHTLSNSSQRFIRMNTKIGQCNLKPFVTLNCEDLEFSSQGVSVASCQILMFRHETGSCYISGMLCPIYTKLHTFDKNPGLNTSKYEYVIIIRAPPAGNRKLLILHYLKHAMSNLHQTSHIL